MTPGQRRWLEKLRDDGPQRRPRYGAVPCCECYRKGWSAGMWVDDNSGVEVVRADVVARNFDGVHNENFITDAGRETLSQ